MVLLWALPRTLLVMTSFLSPAAQRHPYGQYPGEVGPDEHWKGRNGRRSKHAPLQIHGN